MVYGLGLHSGQRTGMVLQPLPENSGIHFVTLPTGIEIPAHVRAVPWFAEGERQIPFHPDHIADRHHLFAIICLGGLFKDAKRTHLD